MDRRSQTPILQTWRHCVRALLLAFKVQRLVPWGEMEVKVDVVQTEVDQMAVPLTEVEVEWEVDVDVDVVR